MPNPAPKHLPMKLTKGYVDRVKPGPSDEYHWDAETKGFGLKVNPGGKMSFVVQGRLDPRKPPARITIGPYGVFTVDQAREVAREHLRSMRMGIDPRDTRREDEAKAVTLADVAKAFFARPGMLKPNTRDEMERHLNTALGKWLTRPITSISPADCRKRYEEIATTGLRKKPAPAPGSAASAFKILRTLINFAIGEYQTQDGTPIIARNPVDIIRKELAQHVSKVRTRHIDRRDVGKFCHHLTTARRNPAFSADTYAGLDLIMFLLLTGCRRSEGAELTWGRVNLDETDPADNWFFLGDVKNKHPITLPLSSQAVAILKARQNANDRGMVKSPYVFPSRSAVGHIKDTRGPLERFAREIGMDRLSAHDLRRSFVTLGVKACGLDIAKLELLTNHVPQGVTARHYLETSDLRDYHREVQAIGDY